MRYPRCRWNGPAGQAPVWHAEYVGGWRDFCASPEFTRYIALLDLDNQISNTIQQYDCFLTEFDTIEREDTPEFLAAYEQIFCRV